MTRTHWWWTGIVGILMSAGILGGCSGDGHHDGFHGGGCLLFNEVGPNDTSLTAQFLDDMFFGDCFIVDGSISNGSDVDNYSILVQESFTLFVTLDHSALVDFDILIFDADTGELIRDCGTSVVPEVCSISFGVGSRAIAVDIVIISEVGAGTYTLTLDAQ